MVDSWSNLHAANPRDDPTGAPDASQSPAHKLSRWAVLALHNALAASRQHPNAPEVWCPARRRAFEILDQATQESPLTLGLRAGSVYVDAEAILKFHPGVDSSPPSS